MLAQFAAQLDAVGEDVSTMVSLSDSEVTDQLIEFESTFSDLRVSWLIFYENFGVDQATAIVELVVRAEPLSQQIAQEIDQFQIDEQVRVEAASSNFYEIAALTDQIAIGIFISSILVAIAIAVRVSQYLTRRLFDLKEGARLIGDGILDHDIELGNADELGDLAYTFNDMSRHLLSARVKLTASYGELEDRNREVEKQREVSDSLLLNILPPEIAEELQTKGKVDPKYFEDVTILFMDFVGFTACTEKLSAEELVHLLHEFFTAFDKIVARYGLEKLKTIGDSYMCAAGLPVRNPSHPVDAVMAAFEMVEEVAHRRTGDGDERWALRIGLHSGPVIAGVVGINKFAFDIWGESVNFCSRVESSGAPNRINVSERTHARVKDFFQCEYRGKVATKEKKEVDMYFVNGILPKLVEDTVQTPPPAFADRYRIYFGKEPPSFPACLLPQSVGEKSQTDTVSL